MDDVPAVVVEINPHRAHVRQNEDHRIPRRQEILRHRDPALRILTCQRFNDRARPMSRTPTQVFAFLRSPQPHTIIVPPTHEADCASVFIKILDDRLSQAARVRRPHVESPDFVREPLEIRVQFD
jgi:hypothetical protein